MERFEPHIDSTAGLNLVASGNGPPASTCETHRSRQLSCHAGCFPLSGLPIPAFASCSSVTCAVPLLLP
ncbi:MAG: hypothetical protein CV089_06070 [Nitrospira sp. WS110]|nr:hypothetical protein [Nitrospira sp. WS110]